MPLTKDKLEEYSITFYKYPQGYNNNNNINLTSQRRSVSETVIRLTFCRPLPWARPILLLNVKVTFSSRMLEG
jgi:hypothetical protein